MSRFRTQWLALFGGALLLVLSVSSALGARPMEQADGDSEPNRGLQVSTFVHGLIFGSDEPEEQPEENEDQTQEEEEEDVDANQEEEEEDVDAEQEEEDVDAEQADNHGACVSLVAQSDEVGEPNENHGGAVSFAARVTCWEEDGEEGEELTQEQTSQADDGPGKSAAAHERRTQRLEASGTQGAGHGRGGSRP